MSKTSINYLSDPIVYLSHSNIKVKPKVYTRGFQTTVLPFRDIPTITASQGYSSMQFKDGYRTKSNVIGFCPVLILDADTDTNKGKRSYSIKELLYYLGDSNPINSIIVTTVSHSTDLITEFSDDLTTSEQVPQHRLRVIVALDTAYGITKENYSRFLKTAIHYMNVDPAYFDASCYHIDRQYAPNPNQEVYHIEGENIPTADLLKLMDKFYPAEEPREPFKIQGSSDPKGTYQEQKNYIYINTSKELTATLLQLAGFGVDSSFYVYRTASRQKHNLSIDKFGLLRDWTEDTSYPPIEVVRRFISPTADPLAPTMTEAEAVAYIIGVIDDNDQS